MSEATVPVVWLQRIKTLMCTVKVNKPYSPFVHKLPSKMVFITFAFISNSNKKDGCFKELLHTHNAEAESPLDSQSVI